MDGDGVLKAALCSRSISDLMRTHTSAAFTTTTDNTVLKSGDGLVHPVISLVPIDIHFADI